MSRLENYLAMIDVQIASPASPISDFFRKLLQDLDARISDNEDGVTAFREVNPRLEALALAYLAEKLVPEFERVRVVADLGQLFEARSLTSNTVGVGLKTFIVRDEDKGRFSSPGYVGVFKFGDPSAFMAGERVSYDKASGTLIVDVDRVAGGGVTAADWQIVAVSGTDYAAAASEAATHASEAGVARTEAENARDIAQDHVDAANLERIAAEAAQSAAAASAATATTKASEANTSATASATARTASETARDVALGYRDTASGHATAAGTARTAAEAARDTASSHATSAGSSAATATTKAGEANTSATAAASSATAAAGSATAAAGSATAASGSATAAAGHLSGVQAVAIRYLPPGTSNPATRPDASALAVGDLYWNTAVGEMRIYVGGDTWSVSYNAAGSEVTAWNGRAGGVTPQAGDYLANQITNTPAGGIAATNVQAALDELDTEKAPKANPIFTGTGKFAAAVWLDAAAGVSRYVQINSSGVARWLIVGTATAEAGANAGTNLNFQRYDDAGAFIDSPISINRATGKVSLLAPGSAAASLNIGQGTDPSSPANGDLWLTSSALKWQMAGSTQTAVATGRTLTAGTGLTGGGDLSTNRTIAFDATWGDARYSLAGHVHAATAVTFTPASGLSSTNVQAAIVEAKGVADTKIASSSAGAFGTTLLATANQAAARTALAYHAVALSGSAADLGSGTLPDARLHARIGVTASLVTDWNDATTSGFYMGSGATNAPVGGTWFLGTVVAHNALYVTQEVHSFTDDAASDTKTYRRARNNGTWEAWYRIRKSQAELDALYAPFVHVHSNATTSVAGFLSAADKTKLDGIATGATNYAHPTGDGNRHVPATSTTNNTKVLKSGATAASEAWGFVSYSELTGIPAALSTVGGLTPAADRLAYYTGAGTAALSVFTSIGRSVTGAADQAAARSAIGAEATGHVHSAATTSVAGFLSAADKTKLDGVAAGAKASFTWAEIGSKPAALDALDALTPAADRFPYYTGAATGALGTITALALTLLDDTSQAAMLSTIGAAAAGHVHSNATTSVAGFLSAADKTKLDGIATGATNYAHPTGDGNLHVPATSTTNNAKYLRAGATAGSAAWAQIPYSELGSVPAHLTTLAGLTSVANLSTLANLASVARLSTLAGLASVARLEDLAVLASVDKLISLAALTGGADNKGIRLTGTNTMAVYDLTAFGRTLAGLADGAALRSEAGIAFGNYTPTVDGVTNVTGTPTVFAGKYTKIGTQVRANVWFSITPTAGSASTTVRVSLPVASVFAASTDAIGLCTSPTSGAVAGDCYGEVAGGVIARIRSGGTGAHICQAEFVYDII